MTRPEPGLSETAAQLGARGWGAVLAPMLTIVPRAPDLHADAQAVLVASGNALAAIPARFHGVKLLAVGDATAARARARGFESVHSADGDADDLAALAAGLCEPTAGPLLLVAGQGNGLKLAASLRARGFAVLRRVGYVSVPVRFLPDAARACVRDGSITAALFFSGLAARAFVQAAGDLAPVLGGIDALAIGGPAAVALKALPWRSIRVAAQPTASEMLALLP